MAKSIQELLPNKSKDKTVFVQGPVPFHIVTEVKKIMKKNNLRWNEVLTACLLFFVQDHNKSNK